MKKVARAQPRRKVHVVVDNYHTHKLAEVPSVAGPQPVRRAARCPELRAWLNLVDVFFRIIKGQAIGRGTFASVKVVTTAISRFIDGWHERCRDQGGRLSTTAES